MFVFLLGILFEENGQKRFEGEFKDGEYWNGKCKEMEFSLTKDKIQTFLCGKILIDVQYSGQEKSFEG